MAFAAQTGNIYESRYLEYLNVIVSDFVTNTAFEVWVGLWVVQFCEYFSLWLGWLAWQLNNFLSPLLLTYFTLSALVPLALICSSCLGCESMIFFLCTTPSTVKLWMWLELQVLYQAVLQSSWKVWHQSCVCCIKTCAKQCLWSGVELNFETDSQAFLFKDKGKRLVQEEVIKSQFKTRMQKTRLTLLPTMMFFLSSNL